MLIGLIADTHNNLEMTARAVDIFKTRQVDLIIHAGDLTSPRMLEIFKTCSCRFVLGNGDLDADIINSKSEEYGFGRVDTSCDVTIDGKRFFIFHGDDVPLFRQAVASGHYDYIIKGHTHLFENYVSNNTRIINPGTIYGSETHTIAILDTANGRVEQIRIVED